MRSAIVLGLVLCGVIPGWAQTGVGYTTVRDDSVRTTLTSSVGSPVLVYQTSRVRFAVDSGLALDHIRTLRRRADADSMRGGPARRVYDEWKRALDAAAVSGRPHSVVSQRDRLLYLVADLLEAGRGMLIDLKADAAVSEITVNAFGERCGPSMCGHDGRRFLLPDGTVFLTIVDVWY